MKSPSQVVLSKAVKPCKEKVTLDEVLDPSVPLPQNRWGPQVVMPLF